MKSILPLKVRAPLVAGVIVSLAILVFAELGYLRLEAANRRMAAALETQTLVYGILVAVADAEAAQRGYLLTGRDEYLEPYRASLPAIEQRHKKLRELVVLHGNPETLDRSSRFNWLVGRKLAEIEATIELYRLEGRDAAFDLVGTDMGKRTMDAIRAEAEVLTRELRDQLGRGLERWERDVAFARAGMQLMTAFTIALLLVVLVLARRDIRRREERALDALEQQRRLESLVAERTAELSELSNHLQTVSDEDRARLARDIHDELGGILVSAKMDTSWVHDRLKNRDPKGAARLARAMAMLDGGVDVKRRIVEELRPTLLDNLGLGAAIEWQANEVCAAAGLECEVHVQEDEPLPPAAAITLFRIAQEALTNAIRHAQAKRVTVDLVCSRDEVALSVADDGVGIAEDASRNRLSHGISGMRHRARALGGAFSVRGRADGGTVVEVTVPLRAAAAGASAPGAAARTTA
jgi:signal transduction histidine kinase